MSIKIVRKIVCLFDGKEEVEEERFTMNEKGLQVRNIWGIDASKLIKNLMRL